MKALSKNERIMLAAEIADLLFADSTRGPAGPRTDALRAMLDRIAQVLDPQAPKDPRTANR